MMESVGEYLKRERELRGVSLKDISEFSKVSVGLLKALEDGNSEALPHKTFVKGFVSAYCKCLGLDDTDAVLRYEAYLNESAEETKEQDGGRVATGKSGESWIGRILRSKRVVSLFLLASGFLVMLMLLVYTGERGVQSATDVVAPKDAVKVGLHEPASSAAMEEADLVDTVIVEDFLSEDFDPGVREAQSLKTSALPVLVEDASVLSENVNVNLHELNIYAKETTWVKAEFNGYEPSDVSDGQREYREVLLRRGERVSWKAAQLSLLIGNANGLELEFDGKPIELSGYSGEVVSLILP
jgi:cytoskeletal protein RodZ